MAKKGQEKHQYKDIIQKLTQNTQNYNNHFLSKYSSPQGYESALGYLYHTLQKFDLSQFNKEDYDFLSDLIQEENTGSTKGVYIKSYFKFLYANSLLIDDSGFEDVFGTKKNAIENIAKSRKSKHKSQNATERRDILRLGEINAYNKLLNTQSERNLTVRHLVAWYLLFERHLPVEYLRTINHNRYFEDGLLDHNNERIVLPEQFQEFWKENYNKKKNNGYRDLDDCIKNIGRIIGIENITPIKVKASGEASLFQCPNCDSYYKNTSDNWVLYNNRIICKACADTIKKNSDADIGSISEYNTDVGDNSDVLTPSPSFYSYDELKTKYLKNDYLKKQKRQIEIGDLGEAFILDMEYKKLKGTQYAYYIEDKSDNPETGYDILSYDLDGKEIYIEVKTSEFVNVPFFMTEHEISIGKKLLQDKKKYLVYRVENILADNKADIVVTKLESIFSNTTYNFKPYTWKVSSNEMHNKQL